MKKSKIFMAGGAFVLAITAMFATKANKKFGTGVTSAYIKGSSGVYIQVPLGASLTTTSGSPNVLAYATLYTGGGAKKFQGTLYDAKSGDSRAVYFHP